MIASSIPSRSSPTGLGAFSLISAAAPAAAATGPLAPFILAGTAAIGPAIALFTRLAQGCGETCLVSSGYADEAERSLIEVNRQFFAQPTITPELKTKALEFVDKVLNQLRQLCSQPQLGAAGQRCISERLVKGGSAPWCPTGTGCDWITLYRDPIANAPLTAPTAQPGGGGSSLTASGGGGGGIVATITQGSTAGIPNWAIALALGGLLIFALGDD